MLTIIISNLLNVIRSALVTSRKFSIAMFLGGILVILVTPSQYLRVASVLIWLTAALVSDRGNMSALKNFPRPFQFALNACKNFLKFFLFAVLGIVGAVLYALPWLLRATALLIWLGGAYLGIIVIETIYAPYSPAIPVIALQFAVILASVAWMSILLNKNARFLWGGVAAGGLVIGGMALGAAWMAEHWKYASLLFRVLPPALFSVLLIHETIRLRALRQKGRLTNPFHKINDRHESDEHPPLERRDRQPKQGLP
jgi:hypothetical protein